MIDCVQKMKNIEEAVAWSGREWSGLNKSGHGRCG